MKRKCPERPKSSCVIDTNKLLEGWLDRWKDLSTSIALLTVWEAVDC